MQAAPEEVRRPEPVKSVEAGLLGSREAPPACTDRHTSAWAAAPGAGHAREAGAAADKAAGGSDLKLSLPAGTGAGWGRAQPEAVPPSGPCGGQQQQPASAGPGAAGTGATFDCSLADAHQAQQQQQDDGAQQCSDGAALQAGGSQGSAAIPDASSSGSSAASTARSQGSGSSHSGPGSNDELQLSSEVKWYTTHARPCSTLQRSVAVILYPKHVQGTQRLHDASAGLCSPAAAVQAGVHGPCKGGRDPGAVGRRHDALPVQCGRGCPAG